jgi:large subunit ribosomal protein L21
MYAVIKTGGKQYRVQPGDLLVVEKLEGDVGAEIAFNEVLMLGDDGQTHLGAPMVDGAVVRATLVETRKGDKVKILKKIRRQGYRRTKGHRQIETVLRVTGLEGAGLSAKWDGEVDLTPLSTLRLRARGLAPRVEAEAVVEAPKAAPKKASSKKASSKKAVEAKAEIVDEQAAADAAPAAPVVEAAETAPKPAKAAKKAVAADLVDEQEAAVEAAPAKPKKAAAKKKASDDAASETE